ncbi:MAG: hypothetical protein U0625_03340 [Phycisphaerales bacterium]
MSPTRAGSRGAAGLAGALVVLAGLAWAPPPAAPSPDAPPAHDTPGAPPADAPGGARARDGGRWRPEMPLSPEMIDRIIEVARDVSPDLAKEIEERRASAPEEMSQAVRQNARRLFSLAILKQRNPDLYRIRVEDLRLQLELRTLGEKYRAAEQAKNTAQMTDLESQIAAKVRTQVELDLRARAAELVALDQQLKTMREELRAEQGQTQARTAERIDAVKKGQQIRQRGPFGDEERPRGERPDAGAPNQRAKPAGAGGAGGGGAGGAGGSGGAPAPGGA